MSITRFAVIDDERKLMLGVDKANLFEPGMVYEATDIIGEIVIRKVGKYVLPKTAHDAKYNVGATEGSDVNQQVYSGAHLYTEEEYLQMNKHLNK